MSVAEPNSQSETIEARTKMLRIGEAALLGGMVGVTLDVMDLGHGFLRFHHLILAGCLLGALIGLGGFRKLMWAVVGGMLGLVLIVSYSPLAGFLMRGIERDGTPEHADAVVVLGGGYMTDGMLGAQARDRLFQGLQLLKAGYTDRLILTRPFGLSDKAPEAAEREMQQLGMNFDVEVVGPVRNTHDEALAVAKLVREHGWSKVLLVTHAWHMRRAAAVFEKAGVPVVCSACPESRYDLVSLETSGDRIDAFRDWLHESVGYWVYQLRGWI